MPGSQAASTTPKPKPSIAGGTADKNRGAEFKAFQACLAKQGVKAPAFGGPGAGGPGAGGPGAGGPGAGGPGAAQPKLDAKTQKAYTACASLRPKGDFGGEFRAGGTEFAAFVSCMKDHKVVIPVPSFGAPKPTTAPKPTPSATSTNKRKPSLAPSAGGQERGGRGFLASLNQKDPKVAAALKICGALLPTQ